MHERTQCREGEPEIAPGQSEVCHVRLSQVNARLEAKSLNGTATHVQHVRRNVDTVEFKASPGQWDQDTTRAAGQLQEGGAVLACQQ